ncbi:alpha/beta fold hydrolase [Allorhizobium undicola]|uniref:alpha/beta fold hydrolase n=1 Tax=Allorhizobium undicola TaxID=78527 RepID=UPI0005681CF4|nr:alpha/beta fold hydrolase [Allorhizobium undicola]
MQNPDAPEPASTGRQQPAGLPVSFHGSFGLYTEARGPVARRACVLFLQPWGYEEQCTHKFFRLIADELAERGIASLRFDYPGTGDALDLPPEAASLDVWRNAVTAAFGELSRLTGHAPVFIIGHGIGASIGLSMADGFGAALAGIAVMAPVVSGRSYLRELQLWSRVIDDGLGLPEHLRSTDAVSIGGHVMAPAIAAGVKAMTAGALLPQMPRPSLYLVRGDRAADKELADAAIAGNPQAEVADYIGYDAMVANPAMAEMPHEAGETVVQWIDAKASQDARTVLDPQQEPAILRGDGFCETAMRFGPSQRLYGVLTEPLGKRRGAAALLLNTAYDRHCGWGRNGVAMARKLAAQGIASFRFDPANVGDSPPVPGAAQQVLYAKSQEDDVLAALDVLESRNLLPAIAVGRCSGGYLAFRSLIRDERLRGGCLANPYVFYWDPARPVDASLSVVPRSLDTYRKLLLSPQTLRRIFDGRVDLKNAMRNFLRVGIQRFLLKTGLHHVVSAEARTMHRDIRRAFGRLEGRGVPLYLLYSENDVGLEHFYQQFGVDGRGLQRYSTAKLEMLEGVDHNFSPAWSRERYTQKVVELALVCNEVPSGKP